MRRFLSLILVALAVILGFWYFSGHQEQEVPAPEANQAPADIIVPKPAAFPKTITMLPVAESANLLNSSEQTPEEDLSLIQSMLRFHRRALGGNPVGLNDEITAALTGKNIKGAASLTIDHPAISKQGELVDRWGTPYRFHAYSEKLMEVRSAGPDRKFNTADDLKLLE